MKLEDQVCNLGLSKRLKELGVEQDAYFAWAELKRGDIVLWDLDTQRFPRGPNPMERIICSAFTVAELGEILEGDIKRISYSDHFRSWRLYYDIGKEEHLKGTEADARAKMLIYLLENKLISFDEGRKTGGI